MSLALTAALEGNLAEMLRAEVVAGERAATAAMMNVTGRAKQRLRDQVTGAGLGRGLANAWRSDVYPKGRNSLNAAGFIHTRAQQVIRAFNEGSLIRSSKGFFLAIPTKAVPSNLSFIDPVSGNLRRRQRATPRAVEQALGLKLRFVYRPGRASLLVADQARLTAKGMARRASKTSIAKGKVATVVMFILVPQVRMPKRLDVARVQAAAEAELPDEIVRQWDIAA